jgi:hypothetical protein
MIIHGKLSLLWRKTATCWRFAAVSVVFLVFLVRHFEQIPSLQTPTTLVVRSSSVPDLLGANPAGIWYSMIRPFALATWVTDLGKCRFGF